jgi:hypothetical protein
MIHYTCDLCKRELDHDGPRYAVKIEVSAAFDPLAADEADDDRDHLLEVQEILERLDPDDCDDAGDGVYRELHFDLCPECRRKFVKNPLGREPMVQFDFSKN